MDDERQRAVAHKMVDWLFDAGENKDTVIWEEAEMDNLQPIRNTYRLTFKKLND